MTGNVLISWSIDSSVYFWLVNFCLYIFQVGYKPKGQVPMHMSIEKWNLGIIIALG